MRAASAKESRSVTPADRRARRKHGRIPILVQIEARTKKGSSLGRATDISSGGMMIESTDTLPVNTTVVVRFSLPPENQRIEARGRVVREKRSKSLGVSFLDLSERDRQKIVKYMVHYFQRRAATIPLFEKEQVSGPRRRRSGRFSRRSAVMLSWQEEGGQARQEAAETQSLSKHGARVLTFSKLLPGQPVQMMSPGTDKAANAHVVSCREAERPGRLEVGLEFVEGEDFWGIKFPAEPAPPPAVDRRRSERIPRLLGVVLCWVDDSGRAHQELGDTLNLSRHGAALSIEIELPVCHRFRVRAPQIDREADAHVVWARPGNILGRTEMGIEFLTEADFWGIAFPQTASSPSS